jgi:hypothetical protein
VLSATHCTPGEINYFTCNVKGSDKLVSVCGNQFRSHDNPDGQINDDAWLQYRFGRPGQVELIYPAAKTPLIKKFSGEYILANDIRLYSLTFFNHGFSYEIEFVHDWNIRVKGKGRSTALTCEDRPTTQFSDNLNNFFELVRNLAF